VHSPLWHDCTLYLEDVEGFQHSTFVHYVYDKIGSAQNVNIYFDLTLVRVNVVYHGGPIISVHQMAFYDCKFDFDVPTAPSGRGKDLLAAIVSNSFEDRNLNITVPLPPLATRS
jgi:hypothetical protein